jgi:hypothetical protein
MMVVCVNDEWNGVEPERPSLGQVSEVLVSIKAGTYFPLSGQMMPWDGYELVGFPKSWFKSSHFKPIEKATDMLVNKAELEQLAEVYFEA